MCWLKILEHFCKYQASVGTDHAKKAKTGYRKRLFVITKLVSEGAFFKVKEELKASASVRKISSQSVYTEIISFA